MTTKYIERRNSGLEIYKAFLLGLILTTMLIIANRLWVLNITITKHAETSHAADLPEINRCFDGKGTLSNVHITSGGRWSQFCFDGSKNNYWRIYECDGSEPILVTQFKQGVKRLNNYIRNHNMRPTNMKEMRC